MIHAQRRIVGALQLAPMTIEDLARCLSLHRETVRKTLADLHELGKVDRLTTRPRQRISGPAPFVYRAKVNPFRQPQSEANP